ncbi:MAG: DUF3488 and transglutaminase-like domain-containing protein [Phycisphaerales bacterium]|nr:DUF3488 and transglutaminase-like domain-containing protein [Phycisphaerales bacterium]
MPAAAIQLPYLNRFLPLAYLLIFIAFSAFAYADANFPLFFIGAAATALSWWLVERKSGGGGKPLPRPLINLGVLAAGVGVAYELLIAPESHDIRQANILMALGHFMAAILICKLFERKSNRDYAQILTLSLMLMAAGAIVANASLLYAILLAIYLALGFYVILLFHLRSETQHAAILMDDPLPKSKIKNQKSKVSKDFRFIAFWSAGLLVAIATAVFLAFPRSSSRDWRISWSDHSTTTGFSDQVAMRNHVSIQLSDALAMEVKLEEVLPDQSRVNLGSESYDPYFRGTVLDTYNSLHQWVSSTSGPRASVADHPLVPGQPTTLTAPPPNPANTGAVILQTYTLRNRTTSNMLYTIGGGPPLTFASDQLSSVIFWDRQYLLSAPRSVRPLTYQVTSPLTVRAAMFHDCPFVTPGSLGERRNIDGEIRTYYRVPDKIAELAKSLAGSLLSSSPDEPLKEENVGMLAKKFQDYLQTNYPYTLQYDVIDTSIDPLEDFLFNRKSIGGHCECFAGAMVMMCRAVGINARMATGYHGGEFNSIGGFYLVREKDAHAWVEVFIPDRGWSIFDPSPASGSTLKTASLTRWFQEISQLLQKAWLSTVVAFDNTSRKYLFSTISSFFDWLADWTRTAATDGAAGLRELLIGTNSSPFMRIYIYLAITGTIALSVFLTHRIRRRRSSYLPMILKTVDRKTQKKLAYDLIFFDELLRILDKTGQKKRLEQTPREYIEQLAIPLGSALSDARWLVRAFYDIRFGSVRVDTPMRDRIFASLHNIRHHLQR